MDFRKRRHDAAHADTTQHFQCMRNFHCIKPADSPQVRATCVPSTCNMHTSHVFGKLSTTWPSPKTYVLKTNTVGCDQDLRHTFYPPMCYTHAIRKLLCTHYYYALLATSHFDLTNGYGNYQLPVLASVAWLSLDGHSHIKIKITKFVPKLPLYDRLCPILAESRKITRQKHSFPEILGSKCGLLFNNTGIERLAVMTFKISYFQFWEIP